MIKIEINFDLTIFITDLSVCCTLQENSRNKNYIFKNCKKYSRICFTLTKAKNILEFVLQYVQENSRSKKALLPTTVEPSILVCVSLVATSLSGDAPHFQHPSLDDNFFMPPAPYPPDNAQVTKI